MIVMLLTSFLSLQADDNPVFLYGGLDTNYVTVPVDAIRVANAKIIERDYLLLINAEQDSIIKSQYKYITISDSMFNVVSHRLTLANDNLRDLTNKQNKKTKTIVSICGTIILGLVIGIIVK